MVVGHRLAKDRCECEARSLLQGVRFFEESTLVPFPEQTVAQVVYRQALRGDRFGSNGSHDEVSVAQLLIGILRVPSKEGRLLPAVGKGENLAPILRKQLMQGRRDHRVRPIRSMYDFLHGIADPAATIAANLAPLQLIGILLMGGALPYRRRCITAAVKRGLRQRAATAAQQSVTIDRREVVVDAESRLTRVTDRLPQPPPLDFPDIVVLAALPAERDLQRLADIAVIPLALPIQ